MTFPDYRHILWFNVLLGLLTTLSSPTAAAQMIVAHRGASHDAPENTVAAFRLAWEQGADAIEGDFRLTRDGEVVCLHDADLKRVTGGRVEKKVADLTWDELRELDVGSWKDPAYTGERIPTLAEVLKLVPPGKQLFLEIKGGASFVPPIRDVLLSSGIDPGQVVIISFQEDAVLEVKKLLPQVKVMWIVSYKQDKDTGQWRPSVDEVFATLEKIKPHGLDTQGNPEVVNREFVNRLREKGFEFHVWTIDDGDLARYFRDLGADSITTNRPAFIREELRKSHNTQQHSE